MQQSHEKRTPLPTQQYLASTKGKGAKGHPKRKGPQPARHIPWPEIFKHHISLIEGHLKMIDMVRKHTVEGTGNHRTISELVHKTKDMLWQSKNMARSFVPPAGQLEQVPLGSSSDTMYPGYSPGHFEYGKAAEEFGRYASEAKKLGKEVLPEGIDYKIGQSKGLGHMTLAQMRAAKGEGSGAGSGSDTGDKAGPSGTTAVMGNGHKSDGAEDIQKAGDQMFFMDSNPTPVNLSGVATTSAKRKVLPEPVETNTSKKQKKKHSVQASEGNATEQPAEPVKVEFEDISNEVDTRMKEKEERRKQKQAAKDEKKRKRESAGSTTAVAEAASTTDAPKPKSKKPKNSEEKSQATADLVKKRSAMDKEETVEGSSVAVAAEKPKKKKAKVSQKSSVEGKKQKRNLVEEVTGDESANKSKKVKVSDDAGSSEK
ncbi:MAG: hypothetical protein Q9170_008115 [Blastenia crenularia]